MIYQVYKGDKQIIDFFQKYTFLKKRVFSSVNLLEAFVDYVDIARANISCFCPLSFLDFYPNEEKSENKRVLNKFFLQNKAYFYILINKNDFTSSLKKVLEKLNLKYFVCSLDGNKEKDYDFICHISKYMK